MNIKILVATHKNYDMPGDGMYLPVQAGAAINQPLSYTGDNIGDNISAKNRNFCELTVLYWAWKNLDADYIGLTHYRRHFSIRRFGNKWKRIVTLAQVEKILAEVPLIMPQKRNYYIENNYSQYAHAHHKEDLEITRMILAEKYPDYLSAYDAVMRRTTGYRFNMFIMRRDLLDAYCTWLFDILFELEKRLDISGYSAYDARVFGFIGERLLDVWVEKNQPDSRTLPIVNLESQHWCRKIITFLLRKISCGRYGKFK